MNDAMPQWRTFSSDAATQEEAAPGPAVPPGPESSAPRPDGRRNSITVGVLVGVGGAAIGAAMVAIVVLVLAAAPGFGILDDTAEPLALAPPLDSSNLSVAGIQSAAASLPDDEIVIDVAGAVMRPGLHRLLAGDRVGDAIEAAGGFAPRVDLAETSRALNLAQPLADGTKVLVPELGFEQGPARPADDGRIDINRAGQAELETLPGIGPVTAGKIVAARADGRFDAVKELRSRGLVGDSVYAQIKDMVRAGS